MRPNARLFWCVVIILASAVYGALISYNPRIASAIMLGYIGAVLTIFAVINIWKKPHDR